MITRCVAAPAHAVPAYGFTKDGYDIYVCPECQCIMADLEFCAEQYESEGYYTMAFKSLEDIDLEWGFRWRYILSAIKRHASSPTLLDVGAGNGYFVYLARTEFGWTSDGLETSVAETDYAKTMFDVDYLQGNIANVPREYDVVSSFNVLEHVSEPVELLSAMRDRIARNGYLVLTTPNPTCIQRRLKGLEKWGMVAPPHHINLFTRGALREVLTRSGFEIVEYATLSTYINAVRKIDSRSLWLRRAVFGALKTAQLGADHFVVCRERRKD